MTPTSSTDPGFQAEPYGQGSSLLQIAIILRRRWRILGIVWLMVIVAVAIYTFSATRLYLPQAQLEIRAETPQVRTTDSVDPALIASRAMWENYYRTQEAILTSPTLLQKTLDGLPREVKAEFDDLDDPVRVFSENLSIEKVRGSFIMRVGYVHSDARKATQIVNTLVTLYLEEANQRLREVKSSMVEMLLKETLPVIRKRVDQADNSVQDFKTKTGFVDFEVQYSSLVSARQKVASRVTELRLKRLNLQAELQALSAYGSNGVMGAFNPKFHATRILEPLVQQRAIVEERLAEALQLFKVEHPKVLELKAQVELVEIKIREAIRGTLAALQSDLQSVETEEGALLAEQSRIEEEMAQAGRQLTHFKRLDAELASAKEVYNSYLKKEGETSATSGTGLASIAVVDWAKEPSHPYKPRILLNLSLAAIVGLFLGLGAVIVTEQLDDRIVSPREVEAFVGLQVLAIIPRLSESALSNSPKGPLLLGADASVGDLEAFRTLRGEIVTRLEKREGSKLVVILSSNPGEGKSTVSVNLARVLSLEGRRVLLFDADMRRPSVRVAMGIEQGPGLSEVLSGETSFEQAVQPSKVNGVYILGAKEGASGAAELADTPRFEEALSKAREAFDIVLVDSAPVNLVSEAALIARRADASILVIRQGETGRGAAQSAVRRLRGMGVPLLGVALNCADPGRGGYGYGYG